MQEQTLRYPVCDASYKFIYIGYQAKVMLSLVVDMKDIQKKLEDLCRNLKP